MDGESWLPQALLFDSQRIWGDNAATALAQVPGNPHEKDGAMRILAMWILLGWVCIGAWAEESIEPQDVEAVIQVLAGDDMEGRKAGSQGEQLAASFIIDEFKKAGLQPLQGMDGFRHRFSMEELVPGSSSLVLNGKDIPQDQFLIYAEAPTLALTDIEGMDLKKFGADDDLSKQFGQIFNSPEPTLVLVHPKHQAFFQRIHGFLGDSRILGAEKRSHKVFILTEEQEVNSLEGKLTNTLENVNFANVVGVLPGKRTDEYLLFSAHYDHLGKIEPVDGDAIANGADDDASGVTGIILLARYFAAGEMPERTLVFVAFTAEEMGTLGSRQFSKVIKPEQIVAGINLEMIGKPSKFGKGQVFLTGFDRSDLGSLMQKRMENTEFALHPDPYPTMNLFFRSDNAPFARLGVPAHTVSAAQIDQDKFYHTVDDEVETLDMEHLTAAIKAVATGVAGLVNGEDTPTRLKTSP